MPIFSLQVEKHLLSGILRNPTVLADIDSFVTETDFYNDFHQTLFCLVRESVFKGEKIDKILLPQKIKNLGISFKDDIDVFSYVESLYFVNITPKATIAAAKELMKIRIRREVHETCAKIQQLAIKSGEKEIEAFVSEADSLYNSKINSFQYNDAVEDIFDGLEDIIEERGNNPVNEMGLSTPFAEFNKRFGGLRHGNLYAIASRPGNGKTTFLFSMGLGTSLMSKFSVPCISFDTEMFTLDMRFRAVASLTGINPWYLETGNWRKNPEMVEIVRSTWKKIKGYTFSHIQIGNKNIDQVCSIARRWHLSKVGRGKESIIEYDYLKMTGEKLDKNNAEHQIIGNKVDRLKKLGEELKSTIFTAIQLNRDGENHNRKEVVDDSSAIALSDKLQWFASNVGIFRKKTPDEIEHDGMHFGTHKYINIKSRFQGGQGPGQHDLVKIEQENGRPRYIPNYINFSVDNFKVEERGTLKDVIDAKDRKYNIQDSKSNDGILM